MSNARYEILDTYTGQRSPKAAAQRFGALLGADRGVPTRIVRVGRGTYDCVADDGRAVRFTSYATAHRRVLQHPCDECGEREGAPLGPGAYVCPPCFDALRG